MWRLRWTRYKSSWIADSVSKFSIVTEGTPRLVQRPFRSTVTRFNSASLCNNPYMTDPNSASSQPEEVNSAPSLLWLKVTQLASMVWFWLMVIAVAWALSNHLYGEPLPTSSNSALYYILTGICFLVWTMTEPFKYFMPEWAAIVPALSLASVMVLKYDTYLFAVGVNLVWLLTAFHYARGHVFPWSPYVRLCFVSDRLIYAAKAKETPKES
jgi:hypothetical protein